MKRDEEIYKLVYKKGMRYLLTTFKHRTHKRMKKRDLEQRFYDHYFKDAFDKHNIFLSINKKDSGDNQSLFNPKTINTKYVQSIFKSPEFSKDFKTYVESTFLVDYEEGTEFKIDKILEKCDQLYAEEDDSRRLERVKEYFEINAKCKFPWTSKELRYAKEKILKHFERNNEMDE